MSLSEAMLFRDNDVVIFCTLHDAAYNSMFHDFADHTGEENWSVVLRLMVLDSCHKCCPPASRVNAISE